MQEYFKDDPLLDTIERGLQRADKEKELMKLLAEADKAFKNNTAVPDKILRDFKKLLENLKESIPELKKIESIKGVLFYVGH